MRVVITGCNGFIGRRLMARFQATGVDVLGVDRTDSTDEVDHCSDLTDPSSLMPAKSDESGFTLIHLAWSTHRPAEFAPHAADVEKLAGLLDYWTPRGLHKLIVAGSAAEYGGRDGRISESDAPIEPLTAYGWGKRAAHDLTRHWSQQTAIPAVWLRPFLVYGPGQQGDMIIPYAVRQALAGTPTQFSDGHQRRDLVFVDDVVESFFTAAVTELGGFHTCNVGTGEAVEIQTALTYLVRQFGPAADFQFGSIPRRIGEPAVQVADTTAIENLLGWQAQVRWKEGLRMVHEAAMNRQPCEPDQATSVMGSKA